MELPVDHLKHAVAPGQMASGGLMIQLQNFPVTWSRVA
jgi:hypothetical protein